MIRWGSKKPERVNPPFVWIELVADCFELRKGEVFKAVHEGSGVAFDTIHGRVGLGDPASYRILSKDESEKHEASQEETKVIDLREEIPPCEGC